MGVRRVHQALFAQRLGSYTVIAAKVGISDTLTFSCCLQSDGSRKALEAQQALVREPGVIGTPTILLDRAVDVGTLQGFDKLLDAALRDTPYARSTSLAIERNP
ncbi:DsbA family protein [Gemmatimonas sp.]|uniref:DsbA family protein n=1 Tax=Gemmatimonas sp. TaxID=1962908 RepID=UPI0035658E92